MPMKSLLTLILFTAMLFSTDGAPAFSDLPAEGAVVHAVLFYSPTCAHCEYVITVVLPPLFEQYGEQLYIIGVDITQPDGQLLFQAALQHFNLEQGGVPFLVIGDTYLIGSVDIPEQFPGLIETYLAQGGVGWPEIPALIEALPAPRSGGALPTPRPGGILPTAQPTEQPPVEVTEVPTPAPTAGLVWSEGSSGGMGAKFANDPLGNSLAVIVLAGMILSVAGAALYFKSTSPTGAEEQPAARWKAWLVPALCAIGLGVAGYLTYVETAQVEAFCGPVGDCNTVQQSSYARLFGVIPIGILGMAGYVLILAAWWVTQRARPKHATYASLAILGMAAFGVLFSIYLTFLEPFVIGATCAWCLTSAVIMTALLWLSLAPARGALKRLRPG